MGVAISLFSGAGGLDLGVERAGFRVAAAVEADADAADTCEKNFATPVIRRDILSVPSDEILAAAGLRAGERPDLLVGGPPCTPFSKSGFWLEYKRAGLDPEASLLQAYTRSWPRRARARSSWRTSTPSPTTTGPAARPSSGSSRRSRRRATYLAGAERGRLRRRPAPSAPVRRHPLRAPRSCPSRPTAAPGSGAGPGTRPGTRHRGRGAGRDRRPAEPSEAVGGRWGHLLPGVRASGNYLHYTAERGHPEPLFAWRSRYWASCSSWTRTARRRPSRPSPAPTSVPSTGTTGGCGCPR